MAVDNAFTKSLLHFDGADGSTVFTDESGKVWTPTGNAQLDTAQLKFGMSSGLFDGTGDTIYTPDSPDFDFGSGDFTVECWVRPTSFAAVVYVIFSKRTTQSNYTPFGLYYDGTNVNAVSSFNGSTYAVNLLGPHGWSLNTWHHLSYVRASDNFYLFSDGLLIASSTFSGSVMTNSARVNVGGDPDAWYVNGHIDEVRISKGVARWTAAFTPPSQAYYRPQLDDTYTKSLLHFNGPDGATGFMDESEKVWTAYGNAQLDTAQFKFGPSSGLFDGTGDCITTPYSSDFNFGSGDLTIDFWVYFNSLPGEGVYQMIYSQFDGVNTDFFISLRKSSGVYYWLTSTTNAGSGIFSTNIETTVSINTWYHIAVVKNTTSGNNWSLYQDGTKLSLSWSDGGATIPNISSPLYLGSYANVNWYLNGYLDEFRVSKGIARWTANFTPSTRPYYRPGVDDAYTKSLLHFEGADTSTTFTDESGKVWTRSGNAQIGTGQYRFPSSAGQFDGTGDFINTPSTSDFYFGSEDFTIDAWVYPITLGGTKVICAGQSDLASSAGSAWVFYISSTGATCDCYVGGGSVSASSPNPPLGVWSHVAFVRYGTSLKTYLNGVATATAGTFAPGAVVNNGIATYLPAIGGFSSGGNSLNGYIDELRISRGIARWTGNFTPPTDPYFPSFSVPSTGFVARLRIF